MSAETNMYSIEHLNECLSFIKLHNYDEDFLFSNHAYTKSEGYAILLALYIKHDIPKYKSGDALQQKITKWFKLYGPPSVTPFEYITFDLYTNTLWANLEYMARCKIDLDINKKASNCLKITPFLQIIESKHNIIIGVTKKRLIALAPNNDIVQTQQAIAHISKPETRNDFDIPEICWMAITHQNNQLCTILLKNDIWYKILIDTMKTVYNTSDTDSHIKQYILGIYNRVNNLKIEDSTIALALSFDLNYNDTTDMLYANTLNIKSTTDLPSI